MKAKTLTPLDVGLRVRIVGEVRQVRTPYEGMTLITVRDDSGEIAVAVDETVTMLTGALPEIVEGQGIDVVGAVSLYKDTPQLVPASVADIILSATPPAAAAVSVTSLSEAQNVTLGSWLRLQGRVVAMEGFKSGMKATLDDGTGQIMLVLWDSVYTALENPLAVDVGAEVVVAGELGSFEDELQIVPESFRDITIVAPASEIPWVAVGDLRTQDAGRVVRLRGVLGTPEGFSAGAKALLDDGTGSITVLLWTNILTALDPQPSEGQTVEVIGVIQEYRGELEILPRSTLDWRTGGH